jgi:hypothetical protein
MHATDRLLGSSHGLEAVRARKRLACWPRILTVVRRRLRGWCARKQEFWYYVPGAHRRRRLDPHFVVARGKVLRPEGSPMDRAQGAGERGPLPASAERNSSQSSSQKVRGALPGAAWRQLLPPQPARPSVRRHDRLLAGACVRAWKAAACLHSRSCVTDPAPLQSWPGQRGAGEQSISPGSYAWPLSTVPMCCCVRANEDAQQCILTSFPFASVMVWGVWIGESLYPPSAHALSCCGASFCSASCAQVFVVPGAFMARRSDAKLAAAGCRAASRSWAC